VCCVDGEVGKGGLKRSNTIVSIESQESCWEWEWGGESGGYT